MWRLVSQVTIQRIDQGENQVLSLSSAFDFAESLSFVTMVSTVYDHLGSDAPLDIATVGSANFEEDISDLA